MSLTQLPGHWVLGEMTKKELCVVRRGTAAHSLSPSWSDPVFSLGGVLPEPDLCPHQSPGTSEKNKPLTPHHNHALTVYRAGNGSPELFSGSLPVENNQQKQGAQNLGTLFTSDKLIQG